MDESFQESEVPDRQNVANLLSDVLELTLSEEGWQSVSVAVADLSASWEAKDLETWRGVANKLRRLGSRAIPIGADHELSGPPDSVRDQISDLVHTLEPRNGASRVSPTLSGTEFVVHIVVPAEGPLAEPAQAYLREVWEKCRNELGMTAGVPGLASTEIPVDSSSGILAVRS